jgi:hypothetical protein
MMSHGMNADGESGAAEVCNKALFRGHRG